MTVPSNPTSLVEVIENRMMSNKVKESHGVICNWCNSHWRAILAELMSTFLLVVFGCMTCIPIDGFSPHPPLYGPFGTGLVTLFNIHIFGHISGAHMNPSVTIASFIWGNTSLPLAVAYFIFQCIGAILGYGIVLVLSPIDVVPGKVCVTLPHAGNTLVQALAIEIILTAALSFICCSAWDQMNEHKQESVPIKIGLGVVGILIAGGPLTGASMNPARSLGPALWTGAWYGHWVYWAGPFIGSSLAAIMYKYIFVNKKQI